MLSAHAQSESAESECPQETAGDVDEDNVWLLTDSPHETAGHTDEDNVWLLLTDCPHETAGHRLWHCLPTSVWLSSWDNIGYFWLTVLMRQLDTQMKTAFDYFWLTCYLLLWCNSPLMMSCGCVAHTANYVCFCHVFQ